MLNGEEYKPHNQSCFQGNHYGISQCSDRLKKSCNGGFKSMAQQSNNQTMMSDY